MRNLTKTLSVVSVVIAGAAAFLALLFLTIFWTPLCQLIGFPMEVFDYGPVRPYSSILTLLIRLIFAIILLCTMKNSFSMATEITTLIVLIPVISVVSYFTNRFQTILVSSYGGNVALAAYSCTSQILTLPNYLVGISSCLSLVICGMRIADKMHRRNTNYSLR